MQLSSRFYKTRILFLANGDFRSYLVACGTEVVVVAHEALVPPPSEAILLTRVAWDALVTRHAKHGGDRRGWLQRKEVGWLVRRKLRSASARRTIAKLPVSGWGWPRDGKINERGNRRRSSRAQLSHAPSPSDELPKTTLERCSLIHCICIGKLSSSPFYLLCPLPSCLLPLNSFFTVFCCCYSATDGCCCNSQGVVIFDRSYFSVAKPSKKWKKLYFIIIYFYNFKVYVLRPEKKLMKCVLYLKMYTLYHTNKSVFVDSEFEENYS